MYLIGVGVVLLLALLASAGYLYAVTPAAIQSPRLEHAHFRMQVVVNGEPVNLGASKYQTPYVKDQCSDELSETPIHLHDNQDQFVHLHWKDITGGLVLKNYGWDFIGGPDELLGYRLDQLPKVEAVPVFGDVLPTPAGDNTKIWVYVGDENGFKQKTQEEFLDQTLEEFFGVMSRINTEESQVSFMNLLFPAAYAHGDEVHDESNPETQTVMPSEDELKAINNLLGNVVIFAQDQQPTDQEISARFNALTPLSRSTCGG